MKQVFNYRKAFREPKRFQQVTKNFTLPIAFELVPVLNFILFIVLFFGIGAGIRKLFPSAFSSSWVFWLVAPSLLCTILVAKAKPDGKNIYLYLWDLAKYLVREKWANKVYCGDEAVLYHHMKITFRGIKTTRKRGKERSKRAIKNANERPTQEFTIDPNGRCVGVLPGAGTIDRHPK